jgi:hypothetical protein
MGGFKPVPIDDLPMPQAAAPVQYQPPKIDPPPNDNPGAGYMKRGGQIADIASNFLNGWMKGKQQAEEKKLAYAQQEVQGLQYGFQIAQSNAEKVMNDPKSTPEQKQQAEQARQAAWKSYLDGAEKYTTPPKGGSKGQGQGGKQGSGVKEKFKAVFGAEDPHLFAQTGLALLRKTGPPALPQKSAQEQAAELQVAGMTRTNKAVDDLVEARKTGDPAKIAAAEQAVRDAQGQIQSPKEKQEDALAQAAADERAGKPINDATKAQLQAAGIDPKPVEPNVFLQADDKGMLYSISVDPKTGKTTKSDQPIMKTRVPPDQRQEAHQIFEENLRQIGELLKKAHPDWTEEQIAQAKAQAMLSGQFGMKVARGMTPAQSQGAVAKAINEVVNSNMLTDDEKKGINAVLSRAQGVGGGGWVFNKDLAQKGFWDKHDFWVGNQTYYGQSKEQAEALDAHVRTLTRQVLRDKYGLDQDQIDTLVPETMAEDAGRFAMDKTPGGGGGAQGGPPRAPKPGMKWQQNQKTKEYREVPDNSGGQ